MSDEPEPPTLPSWALETCRDLEKQIARLKSGRACRPCKGSGEEIRRAASGDYVRECGHCNGSGFNLPTTP